jgi:hypothetical protein
MTLNDQEPGRFLGARACSLLTELSLVADPTTPQVEETASGVFVIGWRRHAPMGIDRLKVAAPPPLHVHQPQVSSLRRPYAGYLSNFMSESVSTFVRYSPGLPVWPTSLFAVGTTSIKLLNDEIRNRTGAARALPFVVT